MAGGGVVPEGYLAGLPAGQRELLAAANADGLGALVGLLAARKAVAFLGAGVSVPLYPLWGALIGELVDRAAPGLGPEAAATCRALAGGSPDAVVEIVRRELGGPRYREVLRELFRVRRDPDTGRSWTPTQELVARCGFAGVVTTNYDPGIVDARMRVRLRASGTGFATWADEDLMDRWRTGAVFGEDELPVLYAHGQHNRPEGIVLATADYRRAYAGKLSRVLRGLVDAGHLVWIGFSFADQRIAAIIREVAEGSGTRIDPGAAGRHVAVLPWDPDQPGNDPVVLGKLAEIQYSSRLVLYPAPGGDHEALRVLLAELADPAYPPVGGSASPVPGAPVTAAPPAPVARAAEGPVVRWAHGGVPVEHFTGRAEELSRLDRWAGDAEVRLVGVTAWGGAGKTALVTEWLARRDGARRRPAVRGVFGWSLYEDRSAERWAEELLRWAEQSLGVRAGGGSLAVRVLAVARVVPLVVVLDGLEVLQEGPAGGQFGRLLDGTLREVLAGWCLQEHAGLAVLTSRFPFADLEQFDGGPARMLDVPPFTPAEGAGLLAAAGGGWLPEARRRDLVAAVDGHALAVAALARLLADHPPAADLDALHAELLAAGRTDTRVGKVLAYYADRLTEADRWLVAIVALFQTPVPAETVLTLGGHQVLGAPLAGRGTGWVEQAARQRLAGLLSWHPDQTLTAHPLVRGAFRPIALTGDITRLASDTTLADLPIGVLTSRADAARVVEMVELLLDADQWTAADDLYLARSGSGSGSSAWKKLPAARLGQRAATAFIATPDRQRACATHLSPRDLGYYLDTAGLFGMSAGDLATAEPHLRAAADQHRATADHRNLAVALRNLSECYRWFGDADQHRATAAEALHHAEHAAEHADDPNGWWRSRVHLAAALDLAGDIRAADTEFAAADLACLDTDPDGDRLYALWGVWWGELLLRTGRPAAARALTERNQDVSRRYGWNADIARTDRLLARCDLAAGDLTTAGKRLHAAAATFHAGDYLTEWAATLPDLAEHHRRAGRPADAEQTCTQAITFAGPRGLVPTHARALATRALARADQHAATGDPDLLARARDDADHALRLATRTRRLPWAELDALDAHTHLDDLTGHDHGWRHRADTLRATLIPTGLDPDPLTTNDQARKPQRQA